MSAICQDRHPREWPSLPDLPTTPNKPPFAKWRNRRLPTVPARRTLAAIAALLELPMVGFIQPPCEANIIRVTPAFDAALSQRRKRLTLAATVFGSSMALVDGSAVNIALPAIEHALHASFGLGAVDRQCLPAAAERDGAGWRGGCRSSAVDASLFSALQYSPRPPLHAASRRTSPRSSPAARSKGLAPRSSFRQVSLCWERLLTSTSAIMRSGYGRVPAR